MAQIVQVTRTERGLGRLELISWLNSTLDTDYAHVQDCADGLAYCQLLDIILPGKVPLHKLNFNAQFFEDNVKNLRLLETTLRRLDVHKHVDVEAIAKGRFKENNEMLQWCYTFLQKNCPEGSTTYQALERRLQAKARQKVPVNKSANGSGSSNPSQQQLHNNLMPNIVNLQQPYCMNAGSRGSPGRSSDHVLPTGAQVSRFAPEHQLKIDAPIDESLVGQSVASTVPYCSEVDGHECAAIPSETLNTLQGKRAELQSLVHFLEQQLMGRLHAHIRKQAEVRSMAQERNFYLDKLHRIEEACNGNVRQDGSQRLAQASLQILSARS